MPAGGDAVAREGPAQRTAVGATLAGGCEARIFAMATSTVGATSVGGCPGAGDGDGRYRRAAESRWMPVAVPCLAVNQPFGSKRPPDRRAAPGHRSLSPRFFGNSATGVAGKQCPGPTRQYKSTGGIR